MYRNIAQERKGKIVFLVGELGRGKSAIMRALNDSFVKVKPSCEIIAASFSKGSYQPFIPEIDFDYAQAIDAIGNIASSIAKAVDPVTGVAMDVGGQLLQTAASNLELKNVHTPIPTNQVETPFWLKEKLRRAELEKPIICLIDDYDESQKGYGWNEFLLNFWRRDCKEFACFDNCFNYRKRRN